MPLRGAAAARALISGLMMVMGFSAWRDKKGRSKQ
jgi:hypothetical protein